MIRAATLRGSVVFPVPRRADPPAAFRAFSRRRLRGTISPTAVDALASAIQTQEGYYPGSLAWQNNNPGNLIYVGQPGASPGAGGFASFSSYTAGLAALKNQITLDAVRGSDAAGAPISTVSDLISSWAPASDPRNNTAAYIASVASQTGYDPNAPLSSLGASDYILASSLPSSPGAPPAAVSDSAIDTSVFDQSSGIDLSSIGGPSSVPLWWIGAGVAALAVVRAL